MRRLLIVLVVVMFCSASGWADSIEVDVNAWAAFTATQPCSSNCTETIGVSFLAYEPNARFYSEPQLVPNSLTVSSSGFLGSFYGPTTTDGEYMEFFSNGVFGDEIDLMFGGFVIPPGINTLTFDVFTCVSSACQAAYGPDSSFLHPNATSESSLVTQVATPVAMPDGDSVLPLCLSSFGAFGLVWRWRRKDTPLI